MVFAPASPVPSTSLNGADANDRDLIRQVRSRPVKDPVKRYALMGSIQQPEPCAVQHAEQWGKRGDLKH